MTVADKFTAAKAALQEAENAALAEIARLEKELEEPVPDPTPEPQPIPPGEGPLMFREFPSITFNEGSEKEVIALAKQHGGINVHFPGETTHAKFKLTNKSSNPIHIRLVGRPERTTLVRETSGSLLHYNDRGHGTICIENINNGAGDSSFITNGGSWGRFVLRKIKSTTGRRNVGIWEDKGDRAKGVVTEIIADEVELYDGPEDDPAKGSHHFYVHGVDWALFNKCTFANPEKGKETAKLLAHVCIVLDSRFANLTDPSFEGRPRSNLQKFLQCGFVYVDGTTFESWRHASGQDLIHLGTGRGSYKALTNPPMAFFGRMNKDGSIRHQFMNTIPPGVRGLGADEAFWSLVRKTDLGHPRNPFVQRHYFGNNDFRILGEGNRRTILKRHHTFPRMRTVFEVMPEMPNTALTFFDSSNQIEGFIEGKDKKYTRAQKIEDPHIIETTGQHINDGEWGDIPSRPDQVPYGIKPPGDMSDVIDEIMGDRLPGLKTNMFVSADYVLPADGKIRSLTAIDVPFKDGAWLHFEAGEPIEF